MIFDDFETPKDAEVLTKEKILIVKKFSWNYNEFLTFQKKAQEFIQANRSLKIYIFCNHPHVFTLGRGNERDVEGLVDFDENLSLSFPVYKIKRGGGVTFHCPGQWIFYPIVSINTSYTLEDHMLWLLHSVRDVLINEYGLKDVLAAKKLMGVWLNRKKLASIGVGLNRFVTEHGIAFNVYRDKKMFDELVKINPCGMDSRTYQALDEVCDLGDNEIERFSELFIKNNI